MELHPGIVSANQREEIVKILSEAGYQRGKNAVKIKIGNIRRAQRAQEQGIALAPAAPAVWTEEESRRLAIRYA